jgi:hypothetical protein
MAENQPNQNRIVMILAATVVVLFIAFIAVVVLNNGSKTAQTPQAVTTGGTGTTTTTTTATSNPGVASSAEFDPATATKVPSGTLPKDYVAKYYQAILDQKWDVAFKMQPAASQSGTVADFQSTQAMYGMTKFSIFSSSASSTDATVVVSQDLGTNGTWNSTWTFVKSGSDWLVKTRKVAMGAPTK